MKTNRTISRAMAADQSLGLDSAIPVTEERPSVSEGERSETERVIGLSSVNRTQPDPEVHSKAARRKFSANYKLRILSEADKCTQPGEIGALLRREGLYSSHLVFWRRQRKSGELAALTPQKRGRKEKEVNPLVREVARLQRENERLQASLKQAETIIEVQKKVSQLLGITLTERGEKS